jgi:hypothetical protein
MKIMKFSKQTINEFFTDHISMNTLSIPSIDLAEAAIDHFDVRDDIDSVFTIHQMAKEFLSSNVFVLEI